MKKRSFRGSMDKSWQLDKILEHGYGLATFCYNDVDPDLTMTSKMVCILIIMRKGKISQIRINGVPLQLGHGA